LLRWHRELVARRWTYPATGHGSRGLDPQTVDLVVRMARENPRCGYIRIVGECRKLGIEVSATPCGAAGAGAGSAPHPAAAAPAGLTSCARRLPAC
jgi:hypothetical protein